jgi:peroxiredoxin
MPFIRKLKRVAMLRSHKVLMVVSLAVAIVAASDTRSHAAEAKSPLGKQIASFSLQDYRGKEWSLDELKASQAVVVAFVGTECPLVANYAARMQNLADDYQAAGVAFLAIDSNQQDSLTELAHFAKTHKIEFPVLRDAGNKVADAFGAQRTPEVFLLDAQGVCRYEGGIDNNHQEPHRVTKRSLRDAILAVAAGRPVDDPRTHAIGCTIKWKKP